MSGAQFFAYGQPGFGIAAALIKILVFVIVFALGLASLLTWLERRQSAMMQDRLGPNRANLGSWRAWGILHFVADALKMMFKEDFIPPKANRFMFGLAPILAIAPPLIVLVVLLTTDRSVMGDLVNPPLLKWVGWLAAAVMTAAAVAMFLAG